MAERKPTLEYAVPQRQRNADDNQRYDTIWTVAAVAAMLAIAIFAVFLRLSMR